LARKREQADALDELRANKVPLTWGDFNQHLKQTARRRMGVD
jgi:predicted phage gp36 major capsid-like protein